MSVLNENTVVLDVCFRRPGISRKGALDRVVTEADKGMLRLGKQIVVSEEYVAVNGVVSKFKRWVETRAVPTGGLREGAYRIPVDLLPNVYARLEETKAAYAVAADKFCAAFPELKAKAKLALADQYDESNYASPERLRAAFRVEHRLIDYGVPDAAKLGEAIHNIEATAADKELHEAAEVCKLALRTSMLDIMKRLQSALTIRADGKKGTLRDATYDQITEFLDLFHKRDIFSDAATKDLVAKAKGVLSGTDGFVSADELRTNEGFRLQAATTTSEIVATLSMLVETSTARAIQLPD